MPHARFISLGLLLAPLLPLAYARAQAVGDRPVLTTVGNAYETGDRYDFPDDETGIRAGPFELLPSIAETVGYDSNVFASPAPHKESALSITEALLHITNEPGGTLGVDGTAYARIRRLPEASDQGTNEYGGSLALNDELGTQDKLTGSILAQRRFEARTDVETPNIPQVSLYDERRADASYAHTYNRLTMDYSLTGQQLEYQQPTQRFRDRLYYQGAITASYELPSGLSLLASGYHSEDDYRFATPVLAGGQTNGARVGAAVTLPEVLEFNLTAGYFRRKFAQHLGDIGGLSVSGHMVFYLTRLTTLRAELMRQDFPTAVPSAFGKVRTDGMLEVGHAYSRVVSLYARARVVVDDFSTLHRTDRTYLGEIGALFELSRQFVFSLEYDFSERRSPLESTDFQQHLMSLSLIWRL